MRVKKLYRDLKTAGVLPNMVIMVMVFGQMNEPAGSRFREDPRRADHGRVFP